nr:ATP-binding protein [Arthrobacter roseus]
MELEHFVIDVLDRVSLLGERNWIIDHPGSGRVWADRQRITQALVQLAANALKFTADGDTIAIGANWSDPPPSMIQDPEVHHAAALELWVRDTGAGIAAADQERIFDRFGRGATGRTVEGSGLGLSIVTAIMDAHGGAVTLSSQQGRGSTFTLWVPGGNRNESREER